MACQIKEFLNDVLILFKFIFYFLFSIISLLIKNVFVPSKFLYKKVDREIVLISGAGNY